MKAILPILALAVSTLFTATPARASGYPADYGHQRARFASEGPVLFGVVSSGIMPAHFVIGYRNAGPLGGASHLDVVIRVHVRGRTEVFEHHHVIQREWNGTGLMSSPLPAYYLSPVYFEGAAPTKIELAFRDGDRWDSKDGANYVFDLNEFHGGEGSGIRCFVGTEPEGSISLSVWNFIVGLMRE